MGFSPWDYTGNRRGNGHYHKAHCGVMEGAERALAVEEEASRPRAPGPVPELGEGSLAFKIVLATRSPGLLQALTARCHGLFVDAYLLGPHLVLQAFGSEEDLNEAQGALLTMGSALHTVPADGRMTFVLEGAKPEEEVIRLLAERTAHVVPPSGGQAGRLA